MKKLIIPILPMSLIAMAANGQSVGPATINGAGGSTTISGNTYEYSIGEMTAIHTASAASIVVTHGVLQPMNSTTGIKDLTLNGFASIYPNPTQKSIYLKPSFTGKTDLEYRLTDVLGKVLQTKKILLLAGNEVQDIDLSAYASGSYFLDVQAQNNGKQYGGAFKIQKTE